MGDGGVACMPLQQQHITIMERFPISEKSSTLCGGNQNGSDNNGFSSKALKLVNSDGKKKMVKLNKEDAAKKGESDKSMGEVENGDIVRLEDKFQKDEVEEGELGTLKSPGNEIENGEFVPPEKSWRSELEKGEMVNSKWRKREVEKGEVISGKWRKEELEKGEIAPEKGRKGEVEKGEYGSWRGMKDDIEKGEFIPDRWHRGEMGKDDYSHKRTRKYQPDRENCWRNDRDCTPPFGRYSGDEYIRRKEFNRIGSQNGKSAPRWDSVPERNLRISSKIVDEDGLYRDDLSNGKNHVRDFSSGNRLKRHSNDPDCNDRKFHGDYSDCTFSKARRLSDDANRGMYSDQYSRHSVERSYRNSSSSKVSADKYISRHRESSLSSRASYDWHGRSPGLSERSPRDRTRNFDNQSPVYSEKSPCRHERRLHALEKSPYDRSGDRGHRGDHRQRSPAHGELSSKDRTKNHDHRDRTPNHVEHSTLDQGRQSSCRETNGKSISTEKNNKGHEDKKNHRESNGCAVEVHERMDLHDTSVSNEISQSCDAQQEEQVQSTLAKHKESPQGDDTPLEELPSMEEDMDICDTPPHVPMVTDTSSGKWFYLDYYGTERGPSKLLEVKTLVDNGVLVSDHLIKHEDGDRWVTVENAVSPLLTVSFPSIVPDAVTQLVNPPEAPGNLLADAGDTIQTGSRSYQEMPCCSMDDFHIDERVGALLEGYDIIPGNELETFRELLRINSDHGHWVAPGISEGFTWPEYVREQVDLRTEDMLGDSNSSLNEKDNGFCFGVLGDWFSGKWSCKGGDWKRNDDASLDRASRKKHVLNEGYPLCQMPMFGYEDPRWAWKDDLYCPSQSMKLDLHPWAVSTDERNDCAVASRPVTNKPPFTRGVKGTVLSVVRINACVVNDHGSFVSEPRNKTRVKDKHRSRSSRPLLSSSDVKRSAESNSQVKIINDFGELGFPRNLGIVSVPRDRLCTVEDLQLHLGDWYYLDGAGHEKGPSSFKELQALVDKGVVIKYSSAFRKFDRVWVPLTSCVGTFESNATAQLTSGNFFDSFSSQESSFGELRQTCHSFHNLHPQFIGYTRGKLHELVMKSYKSREFTAAINEVLEPWINSKQPKKEVEKHVYWKSDGPLHAVKRARTTACESEEDYEIGDGVQNAQIEVPVFEDLCGDATFHIEGNANNVAEIGSWGLLDGHVLARVFHCLRSDIKSLVFASLTCKHWRAAVSFYKEISRQVDLSSLGHVCTDSITWDIVSGFDKSKVSSVVLRGCTNISSNMLEKILVSFPSLSKIDIRDCSQFGDLPPKYMKVKWIKSSLRGCKETDESHLKMRSLKQIEQTNSIANAGSRSGETDDFGELKDYFESVEKRDTTKQLLHRSLYKRSKLYDPQRSSSILSRDARTRRWTIKKMDVGYKRIEEFLASSLKDIMKANTFVYFVPKVAEIEDKMRSGYYSRHGLRSVKEDISRMCRDAIKAKNRGDAGDMNHIITLFIRLATRLEESAKSMREKDALLKSWQDESSAVICSASSKSKKKQNRLVNEKRYNRSNGVISANGGLDNGDYASDREIRRRLSRLNKKCIDSETETSNDLSQSSDFGKSETESKSSDTESYHESRLESKIPETRMDGYLIQDNSFDFLTDDREWGARMTKASLVPPVTRKYEVIEQYVIVADEEDVLRKMRVSLPDDYAEKLQAQKNGTEESDMELPEVKDFKPRKMPGDEVIEQEVYGIDPYTHNLLLDSMPEELDWPLLDKHLFIEDLLLCTLNKQIRHFTGTGNVPMMYPLQPVVEEILRGADEDGDERTVKMCLGILKAIDSRPDDKYVAYRKGLGVVCNKEGGFCEEDFVVEFLGEVYPVWKWFEKQDGIRSLQKNSKDPAPEFYNIYLERPKGDADGYDLVVVDAMHKANYASRICHSCRPNCEAKVTAVDGHYQIGIYTVRKIQYGEEITFDYNSVTESKEEYEASVCLCGSQVCRGSYLNLTGEDAFQNILKEWHGILDRHYLMLEACELNSVPEEDYNDLLRAGLGSCLLGGLPDWLVAYSARIVRFINFERTKLPDEILRHNLEEKRKYYSDICLDVEKSDAEVQAEGVYNQRLQNLAVTLDKVRYVMRCIFGDPKNAPPPLEKLSPEEVVSFLWNGEGSLVDELLQYIVPHVEEDVLNDLQSKIRAHDPSGSPDIQKELQKSLFWLRDEVRNLPCTYKCRHDATADLIHIYGYTKCFYRIRAYRSLTSPPVFISPQDLGPKYSDKLGPGFQEFCKTYGENYCLGQLIFWYNQSNSEPDCTLARAGRGCLSLPDVGSFYAKAQKPSRYRVYGPRTVRSMLARMEKQPQRPWPKDRIWSFKSSPIIFGSPMLDSVIYNTPLDREMMQWLKHRPAVFHSMWEQ